MTQQTKTSDKVARLSPSDTSAQEPDAEQNAPGPDARRPGAEGKGPAPAAKSPDPQKKKAPDPARKKANQDRKGGAAAPSQADTAPPTRPVAGQARLKTRHKGMMISFVLVVILPLLAVSWYLWDRAEDQYASRMSFSVRSADSQSALDVSGMLGQFTTGGGSSDADILHDFIHSQELVERVDAQMDLRSIYARHRDIDPIFSFNGDGTIEDLVDYWQRMVRVKFHDGPGLLEVTVLAFEPQEARSIARAILAESTEMINRLSSIARDDATRYAREELEIAQDRLRDAREELTAFRSTTQIVDPDSAVQGQMGVLNSLQAELSTALIDLDLVSGNAPEGDPRVTQLERRIEVIRDRIEQERAQFGMGGSDSPTGLTERSYATLVSEFERLRVEVEFAERAFEAARSAYDGALSEAQRVSRYLAAHVEPTLAQSSRYPERSKIAGLAGLFLFLAWALGSLIFYSIRDRR